MSNNTETQKTTFWNFLENHTLEIPIIQRDYAQGRKGKEELRKTFLGNLKDALDKPEQILTLDFIYGSKENNCFNPLDGQQRLTTLWLLHWYVAYKADKLKDECVSDRFKKFTYETRVSSREFCERLAEFKTAKPDDFKEPISDFIQQQTWFYSAWKQDPTIQSMLRMLDDLEGMFTKEYWALLSSENCPISFYNLDLGELKLTDDLYVKMNARGEQLTSFAHLKTNLIEYIREKKWDDLLNAENGIPIKMDTTWTDIFWKNNVDGKIDDIYFAFLNRFFLNEFICMEKDNKYEKTADEIHPENNKGDKKDDPTFELLYGEEPYQSFENYKASITKETLVSLQKTLNNFATFVEDKQLNEINNLFQPNWNKNGNDFVFIPAYKDKYITQLSQPQRVVFYAICKYFEHNEYDETSLKHWMRVVWNLAENGAIETINAMIGNLRLIDELSKHSHGIYTFLTKKCSTVEGKINGITSQANSEQVKEEIEKAKQILDNEKQLQSYSGTIKEFKDKNKTWEEVVITAENYAFFKGSIRFLFRNDKGEFEWSNFDEKWAKAQEYFDKDRAKDKTPSAEILRNFISYFTDCGQFWEFSFDNSDATWKTLLTNSKWAAPIHQLLTNELVRDFKDYKALIDDNTWKQVQEDLVKTNLLDKIIDKSCRLNWRHDNYALYPYNTKADSNKYVIANPRNKILSEAIRKGKITSDQKIDGCDFFWGWDIKFTYKNGVDYHFEWNTDGNIYLLDDKWNRRIRDNADVKIAIDEVGNDSFIDKLNGLIDQYNGNQTKN